MLALLLVEPSGRTRRPLLGDSCESPDCAHASSQPSATLHAHPVTGAGSVCCSEVREHSKGGHAIPPTPWSAFVSASPHWFAPTISTVPAEEPSAESFDKFLPRHPRETRTWRLFSTLP